MFIFFVLPYVNSLQDPYVNLFTTINNLYHGWGCFEGHIFQL